MDDLTERPLDDLIIQLNELRSKEPIDPSHIQAYCSELLRRFQPLIKRAHRKIYRLAEFDEFQNTVVVKLFSNLMRVKNPKAFPGYFETIIHSTAGDIIRARQRDWIFSSLLTTDQPAAIDDSILTGIFVRSYFHLLSANERLILELEFVQGLTPNEICERTKMSRGTVSSLKSRGIKRLKDIVRAQSENLKNYKQPSAESRGGTPS